MTTIFNGLSHLYAGGRDLSGDVGVINSIMGNAAQLDVSAINALGMGRLSGRRDSSFSFNSWFNPTGAHATLRNIPADDVPLLFAMPPSAGGKAAMLVGRQVSYEMTVNNDLSAAFAVNMPGAIGVPVEWGRLVTDGKRTDTGATATGTGIDLGIPRGVDPTNISGASAANPTVVTSNSHGLQTGDSVLIAGTDKSALNNAFTVTVINANTFSVPVDLTGGAATGGTAQRTSHRGWAAMEQVFAITGTSVTVKIQDAPKNLSGSFADLTGGGFAAKTALGAQRIASAAGIIQRFVRVATTGTFNPATFAVGVHVTEG